MTYFDSTRFPYVVATPPVRHTSASVRAYYLEWDELAARGRHVLLVDLRRIDPASAGATVRRQVAEEMRARRDAMRRSLAAEARVVPGALLRGILTAVDWLVGDAVQHPVRYCETTEEAEGFLRTQIAYQGLGRRR
jgi:hypothetical protein